MIAGLFWPFAITLYLGRRSSWIQFLGSSLSRILGVRQSTVFVVLFVVSAFLFVAVRTLFTPVVRHLVSAIFPVMRVYLVSAISPVIRVYLVSAILLVMCDTRLGVGRFRFLH